MNRIDFLGAPGVGKTTIYDGFLQKYGKKYNLYSEFSARLEAVKKYNKLNGGKEKLGTHLLLSLPKLRNPYISSIEDKIQKKHFEEYIKTLNELVNVVNNAFCISVKDNYRRQFGYISFNRKIKILCSLENYFDGIMASDESLSQKVYGILPDDKINKEIIIDYFQKIPLPEKLIYCYADPEIIVDRILSRAKTIPGHKNKSKSELSENVENSLAIAEIGANVLIKRDVKILELNTCDNISLNIKKLL